MTMDTLCFHEVRADDPSVTGPCYVDIHPQALPSLEVEDFWWQAPPPHGEWLVPDQVSPRLPLYLNI